MRCAPGVVASLLLAACSRELSVPPPPPPPGPGVVYGRIVYSRPGSADRVAAAGATVQVLGTTLSRAVTDADGRFLVSGITSASGQLLIRFDATASGQPTHQLLLDLGALGVGPGRQIGLGDVAVSQNAQLHGRALRGDVVGAGGHGGTVVYVPQGPFTTYTADDGSFQLRELPAGTLSVAFFRIGYKTDTVDGVTLRAGEDFAMLPQTLSPDVGGSALPGSISGHVSFDPPAATAGTSAVAVDGLGGSIAGTVAPTGDFTIAGVPPGLYQVTVSQAGYAAGRFSNLLVGPGQSVVLPDLVLAAVAGGGGPACVAGSFCQPANLCRSGAVSCAGGAATCVEGANALDGTPCGGGQVCQAGACVPFCVGGGACAPANACHVGVAVCSGAGPVCSDTGASLPNGAPCAASMVCSAGTCVPCSGSGCGTCSTVCVPANPCHLGSQVCGTGPGGCTDLGTPAANGTGCGTNQVCLAGACVACAAGVPCQPANPCTTGVTSCAGGVAACAETGNLADGTACGGPSVCRAGTCALPQTTLSTLAANPTPASTAVIYAPAGVVVAGNGDVYFADSYHHQVKRIPAAGGAPVAVAGTGACGHAGDGGPAASATLCGPRGLALDESTSPPTLYVADTWNAVVRQVELGGLQRILHYAGGGAGGAPWGDGGMATGAVLATPTRLALARAPGNPLVQYLYVTDSGHDRVRRIDTATGVIDLWLAATATCAGAVSFYACGPDPAGCGLAFDGQGNAFLSGTFCGSDVGASLAYGIARVSPSLALAHVAGRYQGSAADAVSARAADFASPPALALDAAGNLLAADSAANKVRRIDGASGRIDTVVNAAGTASSGGDGGPGTAATVWAPWDIAFDPGTRIDLAITEANGNAVRMARDAGSRTPAAAALSASSGTAQTVGVDQAGAPIAVKLVDGGGFPLAGYTVRFSSLTPGGSLSAPSAVTGASGVAGVTPRTGQAAVPYLFQAAFLDLHGAHVAGSPVAFTINAAPQAPGTILAVVNQPRAAGNGAGGPASLAATNGPAGLALAGDGTLYFTDYGNHQVKAVAPSGLLTVVGGTGGCGSAGDGGKATLATFCLPKSLALDEAAGRLYVADYGSDRVRIIDLATGSVDLLAGGGSAPAPGYGDGGVGTGAVLSNPTHLVLHDDAGVRHLYVTDQGHNRIRRIQVSPGAGYGVIRPAFTPSGLCAGAISFYSCGPEPGCSLVFDPQGNAFLSGQFCGTNTGGSYAYGVARVAPGGAMSHVAGHYLGSAAEGASARAALFSYPPALALDAAGSLFAADWSANKVRRIDAASGRIDTAAGTGAAASNGDGGPANLAAIDNPYEIAFDPATRVDLAIADYGGNAVRLVRGAGGAAPVAALAAAGATTQAAGITLQGSPIAVKLTGTGGAALAGYPVAFASLTPGGGISAGAAATDTGGVAAVTPRAGRSAGPYLFQASFADIHGAPVAGSPVAFTLTAAAPPAGSIVALAGADHVAGNTGVGGPASAAHVYAPSGVAVSTSGVVYFSEQGNHQVKAIGPEGLLSVVAGTGGAGYSGDGGPAGAALLNSPRGLALDEAGGKLYVADAGNDRVRAVDLVRGTIDLVAGGGAAPGPGWGDGGGATAAVLSNPTHLALALDQAVPPALQLYVTDQGHNRIRRVTRSGPSAGVITAWLTPSGSCASPVSFYSCGPEPGCSAVFDAAGNAFVSGQGCGAAFGASYVYGVVRVSPALALAHVAGQYQGSAADGVSAHAATFATPPALALDRAENLYAADYSGQRVRRIDGATSRIDTVAGTGSAGTSGDGGPAALAALWNPYEIAFDRATGLDLVIAEASAHSIRLVPGAGRAAVSTASLAAAGGSTQPGLVVDQQAPAPLAVALADGAGAPLSGYPVAFSSGTAGGAVGAASALTDGTGAALSSARLGLLPRSYAFQASFQDIHGREVTGSPVAFSLPAAAPAAGIAFVAVNVDRVGGNAGAGGPGTLARVNGPTGVAVAADGTVYFSDQLNHQVKALSPEGLLAVVAGTGACGFAGDGGPAALATLCYPKGLALDETPPGRLYLADSSYDRVRVVNLGTGVISLVAGSGAAAAAPWGDGPDATKATLSNPGHVRLHGGKLYVADLGHNMIRAVDLVAPAGSQPISTFLKQPAPFACNAGTPVVFNACGGDTGCDLAWDAAGNAYVSAHYCGASMGVSPTFAYGIAVTADGIAFTQVAGYGGGGGADGVPASLTAIPQAPSLAFDPAGRLFFTAPSSDAVRYVDASAIPAVARTYAGTGVAGNGADYVPAAALLLNAPWEVAFQPVAGGHAVIADQANDAIRFVW